MLANRTRLFMGGILAFLSASVNVSRAVEPIDPYRVGKQYLDSLVVPSGEGGEIFAACQVPRDCPLQRNCVGGTNNGNVCSSNANCPGGGICEAQAACPNSLFPNVGDPVEVRMDNEGILLDGNIADGLANGAASFVDTVVDEAGTIPGANGDAESPRNPPLGPLGARVQDPNGFNIGRSVLLFFPDTNPGNNVDDSFLYIGLDLSDCSGSPCDFHNDGLAPRQYDSDDNASASTLSACASGCPVSDRLPESYQAFIQGCPDPRSFTPGAFQTALLAAPSPNNILADFDANALMLNIGNCAVPLTTAPNPSNLETMAFPTANGVFNLDNDCIDQEVQMCATGNDIELVIKRVETSGAVGPHQLVKLCSVDNTYCVDDTGCPGGQFCNRIDKVRAKANRFSLAELIASLHAASSGDESDEEIANVVARVSLPELEVSKKVRCADSGRTTFSTQPVEALIGSTVEYEITVRNTGNEDLRVTMQDVLNEIGGQAAFANCQVVCNELTALLTSPRRSLVDFPVTFVNAAAPPICSGLGQPECLNGDFFFLSCDPPSPGVSFLESIQNGGTALLGTLLGADVERVAGACEVDLGDSIVIRFKAIVGASNENSFCNNFVDGDCRNAISATATLVSGGGIVTQDQAALVDTFEEQATGDDNVVIVDVLCREIAFEKEVGFPGNAGSFVTGTTQLDVPSVPPAGNVQIQYRYTVDNLGEVAENVTIDDDGLCADITATNVAFAGAITFPGGIAVACPICANGQVGPTLVAAGGTLQSLCTLQFNAVAGPDPNVGLRNFLSRDDADGACVNETPLSGAEGTNCYRNCATATTTTSNFGDICRPPAGQFTIKSFTTICNTPCELQVVKQVRCLPNCSVPTDAEAGWVDNLLEVAPGACVQYRIRVTNLSNTIDICALKFNDLMSPNDEFASIPTNVQLVGRTCTNGITFGTAFNVTGTDTTCVLNSLLGFNETVTVLFRAVLEAPDGTADANQVNNITVMGAAEGACPSPTATPTFSCMAEDSVTVDIEECNLTVDKDVTCDDPRQTSPAPVYEAEGDDLVDVLPGSEVGFRIQVTNTGAVDLTSVNITDVFDRPTWYLVSSVVADINGTAATNCICTSPVGNCDSITDLNGNKTLTTCKADGIAPGQVLTITFRVRVPADFMTIGVTPDATNTVTVRGGTDVCQNPQANPCPEASSSARINVLVPKLDCDKQVCADLDRNGTCDANFPFAASLDVPAEAAIYPLAIIWKYTVTNQGETAYSSSTITDAQLIADRNANGLTSPSCAAFNASGVANLGTIDVAGANSMRMVTCSILFNTEAQWLSFSAKDDDGVASCYNNTAQGLGNVNTNNLCARGADTSIETTPCEADVCIRQPCDVTVRKQVRCLPTCSPTALGAEEGWVEDPSQLMATPGSCLQYRIIVENTSLGDVDICALKFDDTMTNKDSFQTIPQSVQLQGRSCTNLTFATAFNVDGNDVTCRLNQVLGVGDRVTVLFTGVLRPDAIADPINRVEVMGAAEPTGCDLTLPVFSCTDDASVTVDIKPCDFTLVKEVTCDDPRSPGADFEADDLADALPGSDAGFRIRIRNTGQVNLTSVEISENLTCNTWFLGGSVVADINGTGATNCICTSPVGNCDSVADLNGTKNLTGCKADGIAPGQTLTITFRVHVPDGFSPMNTPTDCTNTVTVEGNTDVCSSSTLNPCGSERDDARINVLVPEITCDKCVCLDEDLNGTCDSACTIGLDLDEVTFPIRLIYRFTANNTGEVDLENVTFTDLDFRNDASPYIVSCALDAGGMANVGNLAVNASSAPMTCVLQFDDEAEFRSFAQSDDGNDDCYRNVTTVTSTPDVGSEICPSNVVAEDTCSATVCIQVEECIPPPCPPFTKAVFEIWNEFEAKFSGTERCIASWDQELLSEYVSVGVPNYFWRNVLRTDKGKARIEGVASRVVCGPESEDVPLLGLAAKILYFDGDPNRVERAGTNLIGAGYEEGWIKWDYSGSGPELTTKSPEELRDARGGTPDTSRIDGPRDYNGKPIVDHPERATTGQEETASISEKGSFFVFPKVEIKWNSAGDVIQDTFLDLTNDYPLKVRVQMFFVHGDCCTWLDNAINLTQNQPIYWSALTGDPRALSSFTELGPGIRDTEPTNPGGRTLRGYIIGWAVDPVTSEEINWNHLKGDAILVNYAESSAWEYNTWNFRALANSTGQPLLAPFGELNFDGMEYEYAPAELIFDFYASGTMLSSGPSSQATIDTDLTLWAAQKDLRQDPKPDPGQ